MVSFQCEACGDVLTKKKLDPHRNRCRGATYTCIDCMVHFYGTEYRTHTSCMTEEQKHQGVLYKNKKAKTGNSSIPATAHETMAHHAYVEDVADSEGGWEDFTGAPPRVPSPPLPNHVNVFDYQLVPTPNASAVELPQVNGPSEAEACERNAVVRFEDRTTCDDADMTADGEAMVSYGSGPIPAELVTFDTPMPKARGRSDKAGKKDKKRKRDLHVATNDLEMTDAPILHSGLTGGLRRMLDPHAFPPSPDYSGSGGEVGETPAGPVKRSRPSKHHRTSRHESGIGNNLRSMLTSGGTSKSASKTKKRKHTSPTVPFKKRHSHHSTKRLDGAKEPKLLAYKDHDGDEKRTGAGTMVRYDHRADLFFGMVNKGPESERGCSVNKVLKRFHRERDASGDAQSKSVEEKELFKTLRLRRNDKGEIVLFCV